MVYLSSILKTTYVHIFPIGLGVKISTNKHMQILKSEPLWNFCAYFRCSRQQAQPSVYQLTNQLILRVRGWKAQYCQAERPEGRVSGCGPTLALGIKSAIRPEWTCILIDVGWSYQFEIYKVWLLSPMICSRSKEKKREKEKKLLHSTQHSNNVRFACVWCYSISSYRNREAVLTTWLVKIIPRSKIKDIIPRPQVPCCIHMLLHLLRRRIIAYKIKTGRKLKTRINFVTWQ